MMKEILIFGILFFALMTVYNLIVSIRRKESFMPAIVGFFMTLVALLIFFEQFLYATLFFIALVIVAVVKRSETSKILEGKISQELEKIDSKEPLKLKDFLGWKGWAKIALKHGAKKAAFFYASFVAIGIILIWLLFCAIFPEDVQLGWSWWACFIVTSSTLIYYEYSKIFKKALKGKNKKTNRRGSVNSNCFAICPYGSHNSG